MVQAATTVQEKRRYECGRDAAGALGRLVYWYRTLVLAAVVISMTGCSDSSGGGATSDASAGGNALPPPFGRGTVVVTVTDALGAPLAGAEVYIHTSWSYEPKQALADSNGRAEVKDVITDTFSVNAYGPDSFGYAPSRKLAANGVTQVEVIAKPVAEPTGGIARAWVPTGGVSDDGRTLQFSLQIVQVPNADGEYWEWYNDAVQVVACDPDSGNDLPLLQPDCVSGPDGFDASYAAAGTGAALSVTTVEALNGTDQPTPVSTALLLDQSSGVIASDPADRRLFAAKYFLNSATTSSPMLLAAYAADSPATGQVALLPQKPITIFPIEDLALTGNGRSYFPTVDLLTTLEGGSAPLYAAIARLLDRVGSGPMGTGTPTTAIVVITDGYDDTCGSRAECQKVRDALIEKSRLSGVAIVTVGLPNAKRQADRESLGLLTGGTSHGAAFWATDPKQLAPILGSVGEFLSDTKRILHADFRVQSPVAGAFAPGRTVLGQVHLERCRWDCFSTNIPFVVRVP
ncbi:MAG: hypothetical protein H6Q33_4261 [Deltaproteobacteria bacterium]|nr:hypothetical protein [Deltaproteobacteria bacterium]